jgi:hypothetical protein
MEKFYWKPDRSDRIGIVSGIFAPDNIPQWEIERLVDMYPDRSIDFFGSLRSSLYDEQVRKFVYEIGLERLSLRLVNSTEALPEFRPPSFDLRTLKEAGDRLLAEGDRVSQRNLVEEYMPVGKVLR